LSSNMHYLSQLRLNIKLLYLLMKTTLPLLYFSLLTLLCHAQGTIHIAKDSCYTIRASDTLWSCMETQPEFPGGFAEFMKFLQKNVRYPNLAKENGIQGKVYIGFVIDKEGNVGEIEVLKPVTAPKAPEKKYQAEYDLGAQQINDEAVRVIRLMPKWSPALKDGKPVKVIFNMPIKFQLG
jgi:hypothetical protein